MSHQTATSSADQPHLFLGAANQHKKLKRERGMSLGSDEVEREGGDGGEDNRCFLCLKECDLRWVVIF